jgi:multiple sugar transport system substrate-binding protein
MQGTIGREVGRPRQPRGLTRLALVRGWAAAVGAGVLGACSIGPAGGGREAPTEAAGKVTMWTRSAFRFDEDTGAEIIRDLTARNPRIQVDAQVLVEDPFQKLIAAAAGGTAPDVCHIAPQQVQELAFNNIAVPLDTFLKVSRVVKQTDLWPTLVKDMTFKGQLYGIPFGPDIALMMGAVAALRAGGVDPNKPVASWDEFEANLRRLSREEAPGKASHLGFGSFGIQHWMVPFWQLGGETTSADGTKVTINNEFGIKAFEWLESLVRAQGGWAAVTSMNQDYVTSWIGGRIGYWWANVAAPEQTQAFKDALLTGFQYTFGSWPIPKGGRKANYGGSHSYVITTQSKVPEASWAVLENLSSEANNLKFAIRYHRIPIRTRTAQSEAYTRNDPRFKLAVSEMEHRRFVIAAPGGAATVTLFVRIITDILSGAKSIRDGLADTERLAQQELDKWRR